MEMKTYKTMATDKATKEKLVITRPAATKADFISMLRQNGYSVNEGRVKTEAGWDWVIENTNGETKDWRKVK